MSNTGDTDDELTLFGAIVLVLLLASIIVYIVLPLFGISLFNPDQIEPEDRFNIDYHDNGTADVTFNMPNERLYTDDIVINGQTATRVYENPPELLPTNQSARIDVSDRDKIMITYNGYVIYSESVPENNTST